MAESTNFFLLLVENANVLNMSAHGEKCWQKTPFKAHKRLEAFTQTIQYMAVGLTCIQSKAAMVHDE